MQTQTCMEPGKYAPWKEHDVASRSARHGAGFSLCFVFLARNRLVDLLMEP